MLLLCWMYYFEQHLKKILLYERKSAFAPYVVSHSAPMGDIYIYIYRQISNISFTLVGNKIVVQSDVVGALPVGTAPTTSSFSN